MTTCILGEAAGESFSGKIAVGWVIQNRVNSPRYPDKHVQVILQFKQFSCFNKDSPLRKKLLDPLSFETFSTWTECFLAAQKVLEGNVEDVTDGATHYHAKSVKPYWADKLQFIKDIGNHKFYREDYVKEAKVRGKEGQI